MGHFVTEDGQHYKGWLAAFLCCCAALDIDEHPGEWSRPRGVIRERTHIHQEQPIPMQPPPSHPYDMNQLSLDQFKTGSDTSRSGSQELLTRPSPPLKPLNLGSSSLLGRKASDATTRARRSSAKRPSISAPSAFRRLDLHESQRHSLIPLKLAPVTLRNLPSADVIAHFDLTQDYLSPSSDLSALIPPPDSYRLSRESPLQRLHRQSEAMLPIQPLPSIRPSTEDDFPQATVRTLPLSTHSSSNSLRRSVVDDNSSSAASRSSNELPQRIKRKHSGALSIRGEDADPISDRDAIELNTIHEEHKPESPRPTTARSEGHVPAVAPSMQVPARSETLNDIGSIFSRPLALRDAKAFDELLEEPDERQPRPAAQIAKLRSRSSSRVSGWLSSIRTPSAASLAQTGTTDPSSFGGTSKNATSACPRAQSHISRSSSVTAFDSPSLTAASSPTSKRHSRSLTAESRLTSPPSTIQELTGDPEKGRGRSRDSTIARTEQQCQDEGWPSVLHYSPTQVGLAF